MELSPGRCQKRSKQRHAISAPVIVFRNEPCEIHSTLSGGDSLATMNFSSLSELNLKLIIRPFFWTPFCVLAYSAGWLLIEGVDIPYFDDWDDFPLSITGNFSIEYLFNSRSSTIFPVGKSFDSLFLPLLNGNTIIYQAITFITVLLSILLLQWKLLKSTLKDPILGISAFLLTTAMLQPDSYWGEQYFAYHQTIPLVCLMLMLYVLICMEWRPMVKVPLYVLLSLTAGFAYISGAFAAIAGAAALLFVSQAIPERRDFLHAACAVGLGAVVSGAVQALLALTGAEAEEQFPFFTSPFSLDFWAFALGVVARSLGLPSSAPVFSLLVVSIIVFVAAGLIAWIIVKALKTAPEDRATQDLICVVLFLAAALFTYLGIVAFARALFFLPRRDGLGDVFVHGFSRFHFLWITLIWPWIFAAALLLPGRRLRQGSVQLIAATSAALFAGLWLTSSSFDIPEIFKQANAKKAVGVYCIQRNLIASSGSIVCPSLYPFRPDITHGYASAVLAQANFVRAASPQLRRYNRSPELALFKYGPNTANRVTLSSTEGILGEDGTVSVPPSGKAAIQIVSDQPVKMANCVMLALTAKVAGARGSSVALAYRAPGDTDFSSTNMMQVKEEGNVELVATSAGGFNDTLKLEFIGGSDTTHISSLTVRCWVLRTTM